MRRGATDITAYAEGFVYRENPEFYYRFGVRRNPRTLAGVAPDGNLLLVAMGGRRPDYRSGLASSRARIMKALGAEETVNLDGGGSTTVTLGPTLVNRPSDATGERPFGDAITILP